MCFNSSLYIFRIRAESLKCWKCAQQAWAKKRRTRALATAHFADRTLGVVLRSWRGAALAAVERKSQAVVLQAKHTLVMLSRCILNWQQHARDCNEVRCLACRFVPGLPYLQEPCFRFEDLRCGI